MQRNNRGPAPPDPVLDRRAEAFESDEAAKRNAVDFAIGVADGTSGLDPDRLRSARERAWGGSID